MNSASLPNSSFLSNMNNTFRNEYNVRQFIDAMHINLYYIRFRLFSLSEPPRHIIVTSSLDGGRFVSGTIGPYLEGQNLTLSCSVSGGESSTCRVTSTDRLNYDVLTNNIENGWSVLMIYL